MIKKSIYTILKVKYTQRRAMPHRIKNSTNRKESSVPSPKASLSSAFVAVRLTILAFSTSSFIFIAFPFSCKSPCQFWFCWPFTIKQRILGRFRFGSLPSDWNLYHLIQCFPICLYHNAATVINISSRCKFLNQMMWNCCFSFQSKSFSFLISGSCSLFFLRCS